MHDHHTRHVSRRGFLAGTAALASGAVDIGLIAAGEREQRPVGRDWSKIRGFKYQPSYGSSGFELWQKFDAAQVDRELGQGKR